MHNSVETLEFDVVTLEMNCRHAGVTSKILDKALTLIKIYKDYTWIVV